MLFGIVYVNLIYISILSAELGLASILKDYPRAIGGYLVMAQIVTYGMIKS